VTRISFDTDDAPFFGVYHEACRVAAVDRMPIRAFFGLWVFGEFGLGALSLDSSELI
jgi:hypothetical protein